MSLLLSPTLMAATNMTCTLTELAEGEEFRQKLVIEITADPHGSLMPFRLTKVTELSGFVAVMRGQAVINVVNEANGSVSSSIGALTGAGVVAQHQVILPSEGLAPRALMINCSLTE